METQLSKNQCPGIQGSQESPETEVILEANLEANSV